MKPERPSATKRVRGLRLDPTSQIQGNRKPSDTSRQSKPSEQAKVHAHGPVVSQGRCDSGPIHPPTFAARGRHILTLRLFREYSLSISLSLRLFVTNMYP